jgi:hypothetical protein
MNWYKIAAKIPWKMVKEVSFKTEEGNFIEYSIIANTKKPIYPGIHEKNRAGAVTVHKGKEGFTIRNILLSDDIQRLGIGREIYEEINRQSIEKTGKPLMSSKPRELFEGKEVVHELSPASRGLWDKLVNEGRAKKIEDNSFKFKDKNELV